ncbi:MAG: thioesterase family protein [Candidatus Acidiferrales bacterium]
MFVSKKNLLVEWGHCDAAGIVFYPNYLKWFDDCTTALFANAGLPIQDLFRSQGIVGVPLVDVRVKFITPSTYGDQLRAETTVTEIRNSSFVLRHQFFKGDVLAVEGFETRVWAERDSASLSFANSQRCSTRD